MPQTTRRRAWLVTLTCAVIGATVAPVGTALAASLTGSGRAATEIRSSDSFKAIRASGTVGVVVRQGESTRIVVHGDDDLLPYLETVVEGDALIVRWKAGQSYNPRARTYVDVTTPTLTAYSSAGSGDLKLEQFKTPSLELSLAGSGDAALASLSTEQLRILIRGSGDVKGAGMATRVEIGISGSGDVALAELGADEVSVRISGSGGAAVNAGKTLKVNIAGSGDVTYSGAAVVTSSIAGSGRVRRR